MRPCRPLHTAFVQFCAGCRPILVLRAENLRPNPQSHLLHKLVVEEGHRQALQQAVHLAHITAGRVLLRGRGRGGSAGQPCGRATRGPLWSSTLAAGKRGLGWQETNLLGWPSMHEAPRLSGRPCGGAQEAYARSRYAFDRLGPAPAAPWPCPPSKEILWISSAPVGSMRPFPPGVSGVTSDTPQIPAASWRRSPWSPQT